MDIDMLDLLPRRSWVLVIAHRRLYCAGSVSCKTLEPWQRNTHMHVTIEPNLPLLAAEQPAAVFYQRLRCFA